jgi:hypothetical protein
MSRRRRDQSDVTPVSIQGVVVQERKVEVWVESPGLQFHAKLDGQEFVAPSWDKLEPKLKRHLATHKIEHQIPVILEATRGLTLGMAAKTTYHRATLRGRHRGGYGYLFEFPDGTKTRVNSPDVVTRGDLVTDAELAAINKLARAVVAAQEALDKAVERLKRPMDAKGKVSSYVTAEDLLVAAESAVAGPEENDEVS